MKYGKWGFPKQKHVFWDGKALKWRANTKEGHKKVEKSSIGASKKKGIHLLDSEGKLQIKTGRQTRAFKRFKVDDERKETSFTIAAWNKTKGKWGYELNLQAASVEEKNQFLANLLIIAKDFRPKAGEEPEASLKPGLTETTATLPKDKQPAAQK